MKQAKFTKRVKPINANTARYLISAGRDSSGKTNIHYGKMIDPGGRKNNQFNLIGAVTFINLILDFFSGKLKKSSLYIYFFCYLSFVLCV